MRLLPRDVLLLLTLPTAPHPVVQAVAHQCWECHPVGHFQHLTLGPRSEVLRKVTGPNFLIPLDDGLRLLLVQESSMIFTLVTVPVGPARYQT